MDLLLDSLGMFFEEEPIKDSDLIRTTEFATKYHLISLKDLKEQISCVENIEIHINVEDPEVRCRPYIFPPIISEDLRLISNELEKRLLYCIPTYIYSFAILRGKK